MKVEQRHWRKRFDRAGSEAVGREPQAKGRRCCLEAGIDEKMDCTLELFKEISPVDLLQTSDLQNGKILNTCVLRAIKVVLIHYCSKKKPIYRPDY